MCVLILLCQDNQSGPGHHSRSLGGMMDSLDGLGCYSCLYFHKYILLFAPLPLYSLSIFYCNPVAVANKMKMVVFGSTSGQCRLESRRKKNRIPAAALLATLACACAPPPAVSRNKKVSQDKRKMASVSLSIESVWKAPFNNIQRKHDENDELARTTYSRERASI